MKHIYINSIVAGVLMCLTLSIGAQEGPTPTPIPQRFDFGCVDPNRSLERDNVISNSQFETDQVGMPPSGWSSSDENVGIVRQEIFGGDTENRFVELIPNASMSGIPSPNQTYVIFRLTFCARIEGGGYLQVYVGNNQLASYPANEFNEEPVIENEYTARNIFANLASTTGRQSNQVHIVFRSENEDARAYIDNVQLFPDTSGSNNPTESPTPTEMVSPTPTEEQTPGPTNTPVPTHDPLQPTFTPTPALTAESLRLTANPPMIVVEPDDFVGTSGSKKQVQISVNVFGSNNRPIDITAIDRDATIQFTVQSRGDQTNAGTLLQRLNNNSTRQVQTNRILMRDLGEQPIIFVPSKVFDGTVRIAATILFDGKYDDSDQQQEIRGTIPIVIRSDPSASLTTNTGGFNPVQNQRAGRHPGDRGYRPDLRTNLYFRERAQ